jgi:hypothetical protein
MTKEATKRSASWFKHRSSRKMNPNNSKWILTLGVESLKVSSKLWNKGYKPKHVQIGPNYLDCWNVFEKYILNSQFEDLKQKVNGQLNGWESNLQFNSQSLN